MHYANSRGSDRRVASLHIFAAEVLHCQLQDVVYQIVVAWMQWQLKHSFIIM